MPQIVKKRRSGWAILAVGALVASLLAVGSAPAGAAEIKSGDANTASAEVKPAYTACVGDALEDFGFTDLGDLGDAARDIDCLAYYDITTGKTADTFDPNSNVTREHMALFLYRAANAAGVDTMGGDGDADFGDIADLGEDRQIAIKALARNGILTGRSDMAFDPYSDITRAEMAVALVELLVASPNHITKDRQGTIRINKRAPAVDYFADARASVPRGVDHRISLAYELGITTGYPADATFRPSDGVPRRNMASFIVRALAHTGARPEGLVAQADSQGNVYVSIRTDDGAPEPNKQVDAFYTLTANTGRAFDRTGGCSRSVQHGGGNLARCVIDRSDYATDAAGNVGLGAVASAVDLGKGVTVWVWTGSLGDKLGATTAAYELEIPPVGALEGTSYKVTSDLPKLLQKKGGGKERAAFGTLVTFTLQLRADIDPDEADGPRPAAKVNAVPPIDGGAAYTLKRSVHAGVVDADASIAVLAATAVGQTVETLVVEDDGSATFPVTVPDPDVEQSGNRLTIRYELVADPDGDQSTDFDHTPIVSKNSVGYITFSDAAPVATVADISTSGYDLVPGAAGTTGNVAAVTILDQYGDPVGGADVTLSTDTDSVSSGSSVPGQSRSTLSSGLVNIVYTRSGPTTSTEVLSIVHDPDTSIPGVCHTDVDLDYVDTVDDTAGRQFTAAPGADGKVCTADDGYSDDDMANDIDDDVTAMATFYWADVYTGKDSPATVPTVVAGGSDGEIVIDAATGPMVAYYDANDRFVVISQATGAAESNEGVDIDTFEARVTDALDNEYGITLAWSQYDYRDADAIAAWTVTINYTPTP
jgi:hypothetical protein